MIHFLYSILVEKRFYFSLKISIFKLMFFFILLNKLISRDVKSEMQLCFIHACVEWDIKALCTVRIADVATFEEDD
jgi:hypothetical protein